MSTSYTPTRARVPVRTIAATIGMVLATAILLLVLRATERVVVWIVVAAFFSVALYPVVGWVERRLGGRRSLATLLVFLTVLVVFGGLITAFAVPLTREGTAFAGQLPSILADARAGRGPVGGFLERTHALTYVQDNQARIKAIASGLTTPAAGVLRGVAAGVAGVVTIFVLAYLMVLEGPKVVEGVLNLLEEEHRSRVRAVSADCAKSITGYLSGNLLISVICGVLTYIALLATGVPFAGLISLFVAVADLIPLVGATLGAIVAVVAAAIHSVPALIVVAIFFVVYQQLENHLLQPLILSRTVKLNPLTVLIAILLAVELAGILGAFLAIPVAGMIQVIARDLWDHRRGAPKPEPTVGEDRTPADEAVEAS
ncbi:MAG TPA: AI-2E family transporter [Nocardioidaceae bacterium]|nr:AI-2E family transporter [Nocardioidaceae bacterium]